MALLKYYEVHFGIVEETVTTSFGRPSKRYYALVAKKYVYAVNEYEAVEVAKCIMQKDAKQGVGFTEGRDFNQVEAMERPMPKGKFV